MALHDPSELLEFHLAFAPDAVAAAADVDLSTDIDLSGWRHVIVAAAMGDGTTAVAITPKTSATDGGTYTDVSGKGIALSATDDNKGKVVTFEATTVNRYLQLNVTGTGGTSSDLCIFVILVGNQYSDQVADITATLTENGLA